MSILSFGIFFVIFEGIVLLLLYRFYRKIEESKKLLTTLYNDQHKFITMLQNNAAFEKEITHAFSKHKEELALLNTKIESRIKHLEFLLSRADAMLESPALLRETILQGVRSGIPPEELAHHMGISLEEVELTLANTKGTEL